MRGLPQPGEGRRQAVGREVGRDAAGEHSSPVRIQCRPSSDESRQRVPLSARGRGRRIRAWRGRLLFLQPGVQASQGVQRGLLHRFGPAGEERGQQHEVAAGAGLRDDRQRRGLPAQGSMTARMPPRARGRTRRRCWRWRRACRMRPAPRRSARRRRPPGSVRLADATASAICSSTGSQEPPNDASAPTSAVNDAGSARILGSLVVIRASSLSASGIELRQRAQAGHAGVRRLGAADRIADLALHTRPGRLANPLDGLGDGCARRPRQVPDGETRYKRHQDVGEEELPPAADWRAVVTAGVRAHSPIEPELDEEHEAEHQCHDDGAADGAGPGGLRQPRREVARQGQRPQRDGERDDPCNGGADEPPPDAVAERAPGRLARRAATPKSPIVVWFIHRACSLRPTRCRAGFRSAGPVVSGAFRIPSRGRPPRRGPTK